MSWKLAGYAKWALKLLLTEIFVPGGTVVVLGLLLAGQLSPSFRRRLAALVPFQRKNGSPAPGGDLMATSALRRFR